MEESNAAMERAWNLVEHTGANVFITGKAGTGKTTFLKRLKRESLKTIAVLAPTGIAALNAGGITIHSFFQLSFSPYLPGIGQATGGTRRIDRYSKDKLKLIRSIDTIVIDEISMVRADVLDAIDEKMRRYRNPSLPMGGVQLVMIGDLQQLPPVVKEDEWALLREHYASPYFFDSRLLRMTPYETVELTKVFRQSDAEFLGMLNAIRDNRADSSVLQRLNERYIAGFEPDDDERYIRLMTHNHQQQEINDRKMRELSTPAHTFDAKIDGDFPESMYPVDACLTLKEGAQVMFVKNDTSGSRRYYNGLIGIVESISEEGKITVISSEGNKRIEVDREIWENITYSIDKKDNKIKENIAGTFSQIPLRAAWAITIHKSQGLTFDKAIINAAAAFAHGQTYVALSRCRTLAGLVLEQPLPANAVINDSMVTDYMKECTAHQADDARITMLKTDYRLRLILELVDLTPTYEAMKTLHRAVEIALAGAFPTTVAEFSELLKGKMRNLLDVSYRFQDQLRRMEVSGASADAVQERIVAGSDYFLKELKPLATFMENLPQNIDNKEAKKKFDEALEKMEYEMKLKETLLEAARKSPLTPEAMMRMKREAANAPTSWMRKQEKVKGAVDLANPGLYNKLVAWRKKKAEDEGVTAFMILGNKTLVALANDMPSDYDDLLSVPGIGTKKRAQLGREILEVIRSYKESNG